MPYDFGLLEKGVARGNHEGVRIRSSMNLRWCGGKSGKRVGAKRREA